MNPKDVSLLRKIALPINLLSFALLTTLGVLLVQSNAKSVRNAMQSKVTSLTEFIATASAPYLKNYDIYAVDGFAKQAIQDPDVASITFYRDQKSVVEAKNPKWDGSEIFEARQDVIDHDEKVGEIRVGFSTTRIQASVHEIIWIDVLIIFCEQIALLLGVLFVTRRMTKPLIHFSETLRRVARSGDYSERLRQQPDFAASAQEIKIVATEFDHMLAEIQRKDQEIHHAKHELEAKVASRTLELEKTMQSWKSTQQALIETSKFAALGEMASGIAHEINNPLSIISMASSQLLNQAEKGQVDAALLNRTDERLQAGVNRISKIIKGLRSFSREASLDPKKEESVKAILQDTLSFCKERFKAGGILLKVGDIPEDYTILCRQSEISQVLLNLLNNAYDAAIDAPKNSGWVQINAQKKENWIEISVANNGPAIHPLIAQKIFDPFFTTKPLGQGTGLGLSISKGLAEAHHGTLILDLSQPDTTFTLCLPVAHSIDGDHFSIDDFHQKVPPQGLV